MNFQLFFKENDEKVSRYLFRKKTRVFDSIGRKNFLELKIIITYLKGVTSSGTFDNKKDAIQFLKACTEKELLAEIGGAVW